MYTNKKIHTYNVDCNMCILINNYKGEMMYHTLLWCACRDAILCVGYFWLIAELRLMLDVFEIKIKNTYWKTKYT